MFVPWWVLYIPFGGSPDLLHRQSLLRDGDDFHDIQNTWNIDMASHRGFSRKQGCVLSALSAKLFRFSLKRRVNTKTAFWDEQMQCCSYMIWQSRLTRNHLAHQGPFCCWQTGSKLPMLGNHKQWFLVKTIHVECNNLGQPKCIHICIYIYIGCGVSTQDANGKFEGLG